MKGKEYGRFHDENGELLPLVGLLEEGIDHDALEIIMKYDEGAVQVLELENRNDTSGLLPFMYGASLSNCGLDVVYELAMMRADLIFQGQTWCDEHSTNANGSRKRRRLDE